VPHLPREIDFFGVLLPGVLPVFLLSVGVHIVLDSALGSLGVYRRSWHPALVRLCLFTCVFSALLIALYR